MIITRQWLNEFINITNISTENICNALNSIGLEVDSVKKIEIPQGIKIGFVENCKKHPDADKLNICQVNLGNEAVQIVCGASNVKAGQYVPVATIGTQLGENFTIQPSVLRGFDSNGMICSSTEIGLPKINDGIMIIDDSIGELILGKNLSDYPLLNDEIIEIELTPNRGDCLNIIGIAKELSAYFHIPLAEFEIKIMDDKNAIGRKVEIDYLTKSIQNIIFKMANIENFTLPFLYKYRVAILNISKNSDIEIASAYCTHSTGVTLNIHTQFSETKDKINITIKDNENGFAQIIGDEILSTIGIESAIFPLQSSNVLIEASYIEPIYLAKKVFQTKQKTGELYYRSARGTNCDLEFGLNYFATFLSKYGSTIYKGEINFTTDIKPKLVDVSIKKINEIIGQDIEKTTIENVLSSLGFVEKKLKTADKISFEVPPQRHDISNIADITEEIVRIIGIDNITPKPLYIGEINRANNISNDIAKKNKIRSISTANGFFETTTYIFDSRKLLTKYSFDVVEESLDILNPITADLDTFRTTLLLNLTKAVSQNQKNSLKSIGIFEIGTTFDKDRNESKKIGFIWSGNIEDENLSNNGKPKEIDLFVFANKISNCIGSFELVPSKDFNNIFFHPYQIANIIQNNKTIGFLSKIHPNIAKDFDINEATFLAEVDFDKINSQTITASEISKYQSSKRDLSIVVPKNLPYKNIQQAVDELNIEELKEYTLIDTYSDKNLGEDESLTIKFVLQSKIKTLEEEEIVSIMDQILNHLTNKLSIALR